MVCDGLTYNSVPGGGFDFILFSPSSSHWFFSFFPLNFFFFFFFFCIFLSSSHLTSSRHLPFPSAPFFFLLSCTVRLIIRSRWSFFSIFVYTHMIYNCIESFSSHNSRVYFTLNHDASV